MHLESGGNSARKHCLPRGLDPALRPLWSGLCPHPILGTKTFRPESRRKSCRPLRESSQGRQGAAVRREVGPAADGARVGPWKLQGLRFHSVAWSKLLNVSELPRAERRGERTCSTSAQDPGRAATCHIMAPARGCLAPGEPLQMSHCVCLPLPLLGPGPHPGTSHAL